jgi:RNA polymerase sigma factor (sigma-70 family)
MLSEDDLKLSTVLPFTPDKTTFEKLAADYLDFIYASALRQTGKDAAMAADVTQAVLLVLARRGLSIQPAKLPAWLHRVTAYAAKNAVRAETRRRRHEYAAATQRPEAAMADDDSGSVQHQIASILDRAIATLSAKDQTVIIQRYLCGRTVEEVARQVGASDATTRKRLERAVKRLRNYFGRHGISLCVARIPWPALRTAPPEIAGSITHLPRFTHPLVGEIMAHLFWKKAAFVAATAMITVVVAASVGIEIARRANAEPPTVVPVTTEPSVATVPLTAGLSHGTIVSIASIADNDDPQTMWQADGRPAGAQNWTISSDARFPAKPNSKRFVLNTQGDGKSEPPTLIEFRFDDNPGADAGLPLLPKAGESIPGLIGLLKSFRADQTAATIWARIGVGDFAPVTPMAMAMGFENQGGISYSSRTPWGPYVIGKPFRRDGVVAVTISSALDNSLVERRWVAQTMVLGQLVNHIGHIVDGVTCDSLAQEVFAFDFNDPKAMVSVGMETRPTEWAKFENVSLRANKLTNVKISSGSLSPATGLFPQIRLPKC